MQTLAEIFVKEPVQRLIGDNAYDSDQLDRELAETGVEMIAPNRSNRTNLTQDGRTLRRYRHRWKIERLFAWIQIIVGWSRVTSIIWRTSRACSISVALSSCSAIYEMGSNLRTLGSGTVGGYRPVAGTKDPWHREAWPSVRDRAVEAPNAPPTFITLSSS
jgi:hypothetical protein